MCYKKAKEILPKEIVELIQEYVQGEYIYIPMKEGTRIAWGSRNNAKKDLEERNQNIYCEYIAGVSRTCLAEKYFLSKKSIDRIILNEKTNRE